MNPSGLLALLATLPCAAATFELNPNGTFQFTGVSPSGAVSTITNLGERPIDDAFLNYVDKALGTPVNGYTSNLNPVANAIDFTITLDALVAGGSDTPAYPGGGWMHQVRYNGAGLGDWRMLWIFGRTYAPDAEFGFANYSFDHCDPSSFSDDFLAANFPFRREAEDRDGSTPFGPYGIREDHDTTWFTIKGSWLEMENTFVLARVNGDDLEIGGAWGFSERVVVPAPATLTLVLAGLGLSSRRRRA
jgi:hypothetical protein